MSEEDMGGMFDHASMKVLIEKLSDAVRPLGLSIHPEVPISAQADLATGEVVAMIPLIIRPSAKQRLVEDRAAAEEFSRMMAAQNEERIKAEADKIRKLAQDKEALAAALFDDIEPESACKHERKHPDGFCLDCGEGM